MRRSENRGEPRETFASNSRDSQDFEIFFSSSSSSFLLSLSLSASLPTRFVPQQRSIPTCDLGLFLRAFRDRLSPLLDPCPAIDGKVRRSKWLSDFLSFHALGSLTSLVLLAPFSCFTLVKHLIQDKFEESKFLNLCYRLFANQETR